MAMSEQVKERLRQIQAAKRAKKRLLKDMEPVDLLVACDWVEEHGTDPSGEMYAYLRYATPEQVEALVGRIPSEVRRVWAYGNPDGREVRCFRSRFLVAVLQFLGLDSNKYMTVMSYNHRRA